MFSYGQLIGPCIVLALGLIIFFTGKGLNLITIFSGYSKAQKKKTNMRLLTRIVGTCIILIGVLMFGNVMVQVWYPDFADTFHRIILAITAILVIVCGIAPFFTSQNKPDD